MASGELVVDMNRRTPMERLMAYSRVLSPEELTVLVWVAEGLAVGQRKFGPLKPRNDARDFGREALEEIRDALVYVGAKLARLNHG